MKNMAVTANEDITHLSTMRLRASSLEYSEPSTVEQLIETVLRCKERGVRFKVIGGGSNIYFKPFFEGVIVKPELKGKEIVREDGDTVTWEVWAGEDWDNLIQFLVDNRSYGLENLSYIPGTVGASPVQNLNAYGSEVADFIDSVKCFDLQTGKIVSLTNRECEFGYRSSIFKHSCAGRYIILSVLFSVDKKFDPNLRYNALSGLDQDSLYPEELREFIIDLRKTRLPDTATYATNGSFFVNTLTDKETYEYLINRTPYLSERKFDIDPIDKKTGKYKLITASLIKNSGAVDIEDEHFEFFYSPYEGGKHGNIVVHTSMKGDYTDLERFISKVKQCVYDKFGVEIDQEPEAV